MTENSASDYVQPTEPAPGTPMNTVASSTAPTPPMRSSHAALWAGAAVFGALAIGTLSFGAGWGAHGFADRVFDGPRAIAERPFDGRGYEMRGPMMGAPGRQDGFRRGPDGGAMPRGGYDGDSRGPGGGWRGDSQGGPGGGFGQQPDHPCF